MDSSGGDQSGIEKFLQMEEEGRPLYVDPPEDDEVDGAEGAEKQGDAGSWTQSAAAQRYLKILEDPEASHQNQIKAIDRLSKLSGVDRPPQFREDLTLATPSELDDLCENLVLPMLRPFGVRSIEEFESRKRRAKRGSKGAVGKQK